MLHAAPREGGGDGAAWAPTGIFMKKWFRTDRGIVMYLNNGTLQVRGGVGAVAGAAGTWLLEEGGREGSLGEGHGCWGRGACSLGDACSLGEGWSKNVKILLAFSKNSIYQK